MVICAPTTRSRSWPFSRANMFGSRMNGTMLLRPRKLLSFKKPLPLSLMTKWMSATKSCKIWKESGLNCLRSGSKLMKWKSSHGSVFNQENFEGTEQIRLNLHNSWIISRQLPGSFHLSFFVSFGNEVTKISCHFQAKTVQLIFSFFVIYKKWKWDEALINHQSFLDISK